MPINNPPGEQHEEQLRMHVETLKEELDEVMADLDRELGAGNYTVSEDGAVFDKLSEWEKDEIKLETIAIAQMRLKKIYTGIKQVDPAIWREVSGKVH